METIDLVAMSEDERRALPPAHHRPVWRTDIAPRPAWVCAVCWGPLGGELWPCPPAEEHGAQITLLPPANVQATAQTPMSNHQLGDDGPTSALAHQLALSIPATPEQITAALAQEGETVATVTLEVAACSDRTPHRAHLWWPDRSYSPFPLCCPGR